MRRLRAVSASVSSMCRSTRPGTRPPRRPMKRTRTPRSLRSSRRLSSSDSLKRMRKRTSSSGRRQFSVENAYTVIHSSPMSSAPSTVSNSASSPAAWPSVRLSPCRFAHRPLPSITMATWRGIRRGSRSGSTATGRKLPERHELPERTACIVPIRAVDGGDQPGGGSGPGPEARARGAGRARTFHARRRGPRLHERGGRARRARATRSRRSAA